MKVDLPTTNHWPRVPLKHHVRVVSGYPFDSTKFNFSQGTRLVRIRDLLNQNGEVLLTTQNVPEAEIKDGDLLIGMDGDFNLAEWQSGLAFLNQRVCKLIPRATAEPRFLRYVLPYHLKNINDVTYSTTVKHISTFDIGNILLSFPSTAEQRLIAAYLDEQTAKIDQLMDMRRRQMALLKEQRAALIQEAVTRGLNPNVPMKDSGLPWLGEIPAHWEQTRAKFVSKIFIPQRNKPDLNEDEGYYWVTMEEMARPIIDSATYRVSDTASIISGSRILPCGSVIASCVGNFGAASINAILVIINQQLQAFIPHRINNEFLRLLVTISAPYFEKIATAATLVYVNQTGFANLPVPLPPVDEQIGIIDFITSESKKFDTLHASYTRQLTLLTEYRAALIHECVTGQRSVPETSNA
ncbi:restriction endonuclease subunit S [Methylobacter psychrophilus]|uniref:restriction endonuclease subunit S n=1 Tax=Methylobacter psychrophilus TaxID=96941 RepID=UPI0021D4B937|nr:restriction endonuclease subunit S [Methylobacter psychrophilus]